MKDSALGTLKNAESCTFILETSGVNIPTGTRVSLSAPVELFSNDLLWDQFYFYVTTQHAQQLSSKSLPCCTKFFSGLVSFCVTGTNFCD